MNRAFTNLQSHFRGLNWKGNRRDKLDSDWDTSMLYSQEPAGCIDEQGRNGESLGAAPETNAVVQKKRGKLKKRVKDVCARNTKDHPVEFANQEISKNPFKKEPLNPSEDIVPDSISHDCEINNRTKSRLRSIEPPAFRNIGGLRRRTGTHVKTEYNHLANEEIEIRHALAFDNLGLECQTNADSNPQSLSDDMCAQEWLTHSLIVR